jgi:hypothetical protein
MRLALAPLILAFSTLPAAADPPNDAAPIDAGTALACVTARYQGEPLRIDEEDDGLVQEIRWLILDRDERLVLAGAASDNAVAWCHPVTSAAEASAVVTEASQLRAQAGRATAWGEPDLAQRLRHRADLLDGRLVDPLWRAFAARALQVAA